MYYTNLGQILASDVVFRKQSIEKRSKYSPDLPKIVEESSVSEDKEYLNLCRNSDNNIVELTETGDQSKDDDLDENVLNEISNNVESAEKSQINENPMVELT